MITLLIDNGNNLIVPDLSYSFDGEPIADAVISVTLGRKDHSGEITGASAADPIVITSPAHGLTTNDYIVMTKVVGNKGANGVFQVTVLTANTFSLQGSTHTNPYINNGVWYKAVTGVIEVTLTLDGVSTYRGSFSRDVDLEDPVKYIGVLEIENYPVHLEVDAIAKHRTN